MKSKTFLNLFKESADNLVKNPKILIPGIVLLILVKLLSQGSVFVNHQLPNNSVIITAWFIIFSLLLLAVFSFIFPGIIAMANKKTPNSFLFNSKKFFWRNFKIILLIAVLSILLFVIDFYLSTAIGRALNLQVAAAQLVFITVYFIGLAGILIFLTFSSFCLVLRNLSAKESIKASIALVKKEYLAALSLSIILFLLFFLLEKIPGIAGEVVEYALVIPYFASLLLNFVLSADKK